MTPPEERATGIGERRRNARHDSDIHLAVVIDTDGIRGRAENISQAGVFFFSGDALRVTVKIEQDGETKIIRNKVSRQDLAKVVGASREMVSRVMKDLEERGIVETQENGSVIIKERLT